MNREEQKAFLTHLYQYVSENKKQKFDAVLQNRTRYITVAIEDVYQPHNASAVIRSCDAFGIQDIHIVENRNVYEINPQVALGTSKWVDLYRYNEKENNTMACVNHLKSEGYKVIATTPHKDDCTIQELDLSQKTALLFGTEKEGLSDIALENADGYVKIPMHGFVESLNISVCAAICLQNVSERLRSSEIDWQLTETEILDIKLRWAKKVVKNSEMHEKEFLSSK